MQGHYRSNPSNNWSFPWNINPYTGKVATESQETCLRNYGISSKSSREIGFPSIDDVHTEVTINNTRNEIIHELVIGQNICK